MVQDTKLLVAQNKEYNIYAIDLSMKSLSYAKRQINELNINNVNFYHLDILI